MWNPGPFLECCPFCRLVCYTPSAFRVGSSRPHTSSTSASIDPSLPSLCTPSSPSSRAPAIAARSLLSFALSVPSLLSRGLLAPPLPPSLPPLPFSLPSLQAYALSFFAIPAARWLWQQSANEAISERNQRREVAAAQLARPSAQLRRKVRGGGVRHRAGGGGWGWRGGRSVACRTRRPAVGGSGWRKEWF